MIALRFDTYDLNSVSQFGVHTTDTDIYNAPTRSIDSQKLANADGAVAVKTSLEPKVFTCEGYMVGETREGLDDLRDEFLRGLNKERQNFDVDYGGSTRRYVATPRNIVISRPKGLNSAGWSVEFYCELPVGADTTASTLLASTNITTSQVISPIVVDGSYKAEPVIVVTVSTVTGGTTKTISITNDTTLRGLSVTRTWTDGDVLEIDCLHKTIYVNNAVVEFSGQFPTWEPGNSGIGYLDDFTTRDVDIEAAYTRRWL